MYKDRIFIFFIFALVCEAYTFAEDCFCETADAVQSINFEQVYSLDDVDNLLLTRNSDLRSLREEITQKEWIYRQAISRFIPSATFTADAKRTDIGGLVGYTKLYSSRLNFNQNVYNSELYSNLRLSLLDIDETISEYLEQRNDLIFRGRDTYFQILQALLSEKVEKENLDVMSEGLVKERDKLEVGESTILDVNLQEIAVANAKTAYYQAQKRRQELVNQLLGLLSLCPRSANMIRLADSEFPVAVERECEWLDLMEYPPINPCEIGNLQYQALKIRGIVIKNWVAVQVARRQAIKRLEEYLPSITAFLAAVNDSSRYNGVGLKTGQQPLSFWEMGFQFEWDLFDGFGREFRYKQAKSVIREAEVKLYQAMLEVQLEVQNGFYDLQEARQSFLATKRAVEKGQESMDIAILQRDLGDISSLQYREAALQLRQVRLVYINANYNLIRAYYSIRRGAGLSLICEDYDNCDNWGD